MPPSPDAPDWRTLGAFPSALLGAIGGIAWAASLRGWMVEIAGDESRFDWIGTFAQVLLPGALVGLLLGLADYARRTGGRRGWRLIALSPILFVIAPLLTPGALDELLRTGIGGGAIGIALIGLLGGLAVSGRGPLGLRIPLGLIAAALIAGGVIFSLTPTFQFDQLASGDWEPRPVWSAVWFAGLMIVYVFAAALPHRRVIVRSPYRRSGDFER
jgi:hypothetical protein